MIKVTICCKVCDKPTLRVPEIEYLDPEGEISAKCSEHTNG